MSKDTPAFPQALDAQGPFGGLTKRQWYAGMALAAVIAKCRDDSLLTDVVSDAFTIADKMIAHEETE